MRLVVSVGAVRVAAQVAALPALGVVDTAVEVAEDLAVGVAAAVDLAVAVAAVVVVGDAKN